MFGWQAQTFGIDWVGGNWIETNACPNSNFTRVIDFLKKWHSMMRSSFKPELRLSIYTPSVICNIFNSSIMNCRSESCNMLIQFLDDVNICSQFCSNFGMTHLWRVVSQLESVKMSYEEMKEQFFIIFYRAATSAWKFL